MPPHTPARWRSPWPWAGLVDLEGDIDVLVANDTVPNFLFLNQGDGTFVEAGEDVGVAYDRGGQATGATGIDAGYYRNDHNLGLMIGSFANEMTTVYMVQDYPELFVDEAIAEGIGAPTRLILTFGLFLFDYDLDGRLDVLQANGHIEDEIQTVDPSQSYRQPSQLFWNAGDQGFVPVEPSASGDLAREIVGRGAAYADGDADGDLDVVLTRLRSPVRRSCCATTRPPATTGCGCVSGVTGRPRPLMKDGQAALG